MSSEARAPLISAVVTSAIAGGVMVGLIVAVISVGFLGPALGVVFGGGSALLLFFIGSVYGVIAGAVAGADSEKHSPKARELRRMPIGLETPLIPLPRGV